MENLKRAIELKKSDIVTVVGSGGKTSTIRHLISEIKRRLLIITTTHFASFRKFENKEVISSSCEKIIDQIDNIWQKNDRENIVIGQKIIGEVTDGRKKLKGIPPEWVDKIAALFSEEIILIEGDGSASRPIKTPAEHEPVVPNSTSVLLPIMGMKALGKKIDERSCHRLEEIELLTNLEYISDDLIVEILTDKKAYGFYQEKIARYIPVLNQVDNNNLAEVEMIADRLLARGVEKVILANTLKEKAVVKVKF